MTNRIMQILFLLFILSCNSKKDPLEYKEKLLGTWDLNKQIVYENGIEKTYDSISDFHWEFNKYDELVIFRKEGILFHKQFTIDTTEKGKTVNLRLNLFEIYKVEELKEETLILKSENEAAINTFFLSKSKNQNLKNEINPNIQSNDTLQGQIDYRSKNLKIVQWMDMVRKLEEKHSKETKIDFDELKKQLDIKSYSTNKDTLNNTSQKDTIVAIPKNETVKNLSEADCDVSILKNRKEYTSNKREATVYVLWNVYRGELLEYEKKAEKFGYNMMQEINSGHKNLVLKQIDELLSEWKESRNALLLKPKLEELQKISELLYCYYNFSIENFTDLKKVINMNDTKENISKNVVSFFQQPSRNDSKKMKAIGTELVAIDKKYGLTNNR